MFPAEHLSAGPRSRFGVLSPADVPAAEAVHTHRGQDDAGRADYERIVVITRETLIAARGDIPDA